MKWKILDGVRIAVYALVLVLILFVPLQFFEQRSFCIYYHLFGVRCPGCGGTRAVVNLLHGDWAKAWEYNRFAVIAAPFLLFTAANDVYCILLRYIPGPSHLYRGMSLIDRVLGRKPDDAGQTAH